jgi:hypothetical protein
MRQISPVRTANATRTKAAARNPAREPFKASP